MLWGQINIYFKQNIVMLLITESKKDSTFPVNQFYLDGYNAPYRHDLPANGWWHSGLCSR